jgi:HD-GYP domain-containing protein (c-di-GMP phosphodiesterase class II)
MPILLPTSELEPGMQLRERLAHEGRTLLGADRALTPTDIALLRERFPQVMLSISDPTLDELVEFEDLSRQRETAETMQEQLSEVLGKMARLFAERKTLRPVDLSPFRRVIEDVVGYLAREPVSTALLTPAAGPESFLRQHGANVVFLSLLLAESARDYVVEERARQTQLRYRDSRTMLNPVTLGIGTLFMDVGLLPLAGLYASEAPLTSEECWQVRQHPLAAIDLLPRGFPSHGRLIVRCHHENCSGRGYPKHMPPDSLHVFTRIARIADAFDAATSTYVFKEARSPVRALWEMTAGPQRRLYDNVLMQEFGRLVQPFPIGTKVRLVDGRYAVVVRHNRPCPFQPYVLIAFDQEDRRLPASQLEGLSALNTRAEVRAASWGDEDLTYLQHSDNTAAPPVSNGQFTTMFEAHYP